MLGTYEYSDFPMDESYGVKPGQHIPGEVVHKYLKNYAVHFGLMQRLRLNTKVNSAERRPGEGWLLLTLSEGRPTQLYAEKIIVATGLTNEPFIPELPIQGSFEPPVFHTKELLQRAESLKTAKSVTIFGGAKSAWDAAYMLANYGVQVEMIIRESGHGPMWMAPPYVTPLKKWLEKLVHTRLLTWFSPCIWGAADGYAGARNFLHGTAFGRTIVDTFWGILGGDVKGLNAYDKHPETAKLKPWTDPFFVASGISILNYETSFFDLVREGKVKVHIADLNALSGKKVHLSDGQTLETDALILATGWQAQPPIKFLPEGIESQLGIPHVSSKPVEGTRQADEEILRRFPRLKKPPTPNPKEKRLPPADTDTPYPADPNQPWRLYRLMVPPALFDDRSIAFAGALMTFSVPLIANVQALWISAYFDGKIKPQGDVKQDAVLYSQHLKWRYPSGRGARFPDFVFDALPYLDLMLGELGLRVHRKNGRVAEILSPYGPEDYRGLNDEWVDKNKKV